MVADSLERAVEAEEWSNRDDRDDEDNSNK
jgi:hypothetical protein